MLDAKGRLDRIKAIDKRIHYKDGTWGGEYYYEWSCGCRLFIPVGKDGILGAEHRDEFCKEHSEKLVTEQEKQRAFGR